MEKYTITKEDIIKRVYFITKLVQNEKTTTMQGALTSKGDSMGGIFDRFINTLSDSLVFDKIIFKNDKFTSISNNIESVADYYYYKPKEKTTGIAPDIFGIKINDRIIPFTIFDEKWLSVEGMPQIEVKTFKAKDQMISLRNQHYDDMYLVLVDLDLRIDYLVPFLDQQLLENNVKESMEMSDAIFIKKDTKQYIKKISDIDFSNDKIGTMELISITNATDFMRQSTLCEAGISVRRMKSITERKVLLRNGLIKDKLATFSNQSSRVACLFEFNESWLEKWQIPATTKCLDFSATKIESIEICKYNKNGIVITTADEGASFNGEELQPNKQYTVVFDTLDRAGSSGEEYFIQKQCASFINSIEDELIDKLLKIINEGEKADETRNG